MHRILGLVFASALVAGCVPLSYTFTPASSQPVRPKAKGCEFKVVGSQPAEGYEEIGTLEHYNGTPPKDAEKFRKAVAEQVCQVGGDAVITTTNEKGELTKGSIIKFVNHAEPVKPIQDLPPPQATDSEKPH